MRPAAAQAGAAGARVRRATGTVLGRLAVAVLALAALGLAGCTGQERAAGGPNAAAGGQPGTGEDAAAAVGTPPADAALAADRVALTVYLRAGEGASAHLEPVTRDTEAAGDLPRRALELLIAGPTPEESALAAPLPATTRVRELRVDGGTAVVDLSAELIRDAPSVGDSPAHEALALAAIANTLTEFRSIEQVQLLVEGRASGVAAGLDVGAFWGGWGLPGLLVRDESVIGPPSSEGEGVADLGRFSDEPQQLGSGDVGPVLVTRWRARERVTHVGVLVELGAPADPSAATKVPRAWARPTPEGVELVLTGVQALADDLDPSAVIDATPVGSAQVRFDADRRELRLLVTTEQPARFWFHTLANPTRLVLDVKK